MLVGMLVCELGLVNQKYLQEATSCGCSSKDHPHMHLHLELSTFSRIGGVPRSSRPAPYPVINHRVLYRPQHTQRQQTGRRLFTGSVIVVDETDSNVPRGYRQRYLHDKGLVIFFAEFNTRWSEDQLANLMCIYYVYTIVTGPTKRALNAAIF